MSSAAVDVATHVRISDPKPAHCSACFCAAQEGVEFVHWPGVDIDRGGCVDPISLGVTHSIDELHLCFDCVRQAAEAAAFKPNLNRRQLNEIRRLEIETEHWKSYAKRLEGTLADRPEPAPRARTRG